MSNWVFRGLKISFDIGDFTKPSDATIAENCEINNDGKYNIVQIKVGDKIIPPYYIDVNNDNIPIIPISRRDSRDFFLILAVE